MLVLVFVSRLSGECRRVVDCYKCLDFSIYVSVFIYHSNIVSYNYPFVYHQPNNSIIQAQKEPLNNHTHTHTHSFNLIQRHTVSFRRTDLYFVPFFLSITLLQDTHSNRLQIQQLLYHCSVALFSVVFAVSTAVCTCVSDDSQVEICENEKSCAPLGRSFVTPPTR